MSQDIRYEGGPKSGPHPRRIHAMLLCLYTVAVAGCEIRDSSPVESSSTGDSTTQQGEPSSVPESTSGTGSLTQDAGSSEQGPESESSTDAASQTSEPTASSSSVDTTSSLDDSDSQSTKEQEPLPKIQIQVKPGAELCGLANGMVTTFKEGFSSKQRLQIDEAEVETGRLNLQGVLQNGSEKQRFKAEILDFHLREQESGAHDFVAGREPGTFEDGTSFEIGMVLSPGPKEALPTFIIDNWQTIAPVDNYNAISFMSATAQEILGGNNKASFGACAFPESAAETFSFEFANGDRIEFVTKTRKLNSRRSYQRGLLLSAKGTFRGIDIDVDRWESLVYASRDYAVVLRRPALAVSFPEKDGICGLWLEPDLRDDQDTPYTAYVLNCEHEEMAKVDPVEWTIPPRFGGN